MMIVIKLLIKKFKKIFLRPDVCDSRLYKFAKLVCISYGITFNQFGVGATRDMIKTGIEALNYEFCGELLNENNEFNLIKYQSMLDEFDIFQPEYTPEQLSSLTLELNTRFLKYLILMNTGEVR